MGGDRVPGELSHLLLVPSDRIRETVPLARACSPERQFSWVTVVLDWGDSEATLLESVR